MIDLEEVILRLGKVRNEKARYSIYDQLLEFPHEELVAAALDIFQRNANMRWAMPATFGYLTSRKIPGARAALGQLLLDEDHKIRRDTVDVIRDLGLADKFPRELSANMNTDLPKSLVDAAIETLAESSNKPAFDQLVYVLDRDGQAYSNPLKPETRAKIVEALSRQCRQSSRPLFRKLIENPTEPPEVKLAAYLGLARLGDRFSMIPLRYELELSNPGIALQRALEAARNLYMLLGLDEQDMNPIECAEDVQELAEWIDRNPHDVDRLYKRNRRRPMVPKTHQPMMAE